MNGDLRDMVAADFPTLDAILQTTYGASRSYDRRLHDALANRSSHTLVIDGESGPIAMGTLHDYVTMGYVALLGVAPEYQRQGVGRRLMGALIAESQAREHETLSVEASEAGRRLYDRMGFAPYGMTLAVAGPCHGAAVHDARVRRATLEDCDLICAYDAVAFGGDRAATIQSWFREPDCVVSIADDGDHIGGYAVAHKGQIGPWVAQSPGAASALFDAARSALEGTAVVYVPEENFSALAILAHRGWTARTRNTHMVRGPAIHVPRRTIYGLISLGEG